jgi:hypothetical protein
VIPGLTSKLSEEIIASAATIYPKTDMVILTGTTQIDNIRPAFGGGFGGFLVLCATGGNVVLGAGGNIAATVTIVDERSCVLVYSKLMSKWYPGAIS